MEDNINFRSFKEGDYEICCKWWKWWWTKFYGTEPVRRGFLPANERCFIIEKNNLHNKRIKYYSLQRIIRY